MWPLSKKNKPKQFCRILGDKTMFEQTVDRFRKYFDIKDIYVCLNKDLLNQAKKFVPEIPSENYIIEYEKKDTAPAMGLAAAYLHTEFPDEPIAFIPSDHYIADEDKFIKIIKKADELIKKTGKMADIAVWPTFPSTVLGYTQIGEKYDVSNGIEIYKFKGHTEKPNFEKAKEYLNNGSYLWHAGYYMWTPEKILRAFEKYAPENARYLNELAQAFKKKDLNNAQKAFSRMKKISFDYAVTEKIDPEEVLIFKGDFGWSDVGAFDTLYEAQKDKQDKQKNIFFAEHIDEQTSGCLVYGKKGKLIATVDVDDLVIVDSDDALLVAKKTKAQLIKKIVQKLKKKNKDKYL